MTVQLKNNTTSTLRTAIDDTTTTIVVASGHGARFPALTGGQYFFATLEDSNGDYEIVKVTARSTDTLTVERAAESTTARTFTAGSTIEMRVTAQGVLDAASDAAAALALTDFGVTASAAELNILDGATVTVGELNAISGLTASAAELNILDGATVTVSEINILDGVTATTAELNILDGVTATAAELNILDGVTATTAELNILNGVTATTGEVNLLAGANVSTSEINVLAGSTSASSVTVADADRFVYNDAGTMKQVAASDVRSYLLIDEDDMASDDPNKAASQQSTKAYVDTSIAGVDWTLGTLTATTSGTSFSISSLPASIAEIEVMLFDVSLSGNDGLLIQIGTGGALTTSGYNSYSEGVSSTAGFVIRNSSGGADNAGILRLLRIDGNKWVSSHGTATGNIGTSGGGSVTLAGELDIIGLTRTGTNTFSGGSFRIRYK